MHRTGMLVFFAGALVWLSGAAWAAEAAKPFDPRAAFAETDTNGDGQIDHEEFYSRMVDVFFAADTNKDGFLSAEEYSRLPFSQSFKDADTNHDGRISLPEFVRDRFRQFEAADTNHDGELSLDEVLSTYEERNKP
jgi:Ca2+-binding EF-hand superfamily protein